MTFLKYSIIAGYLCVIWVVYFFSVEMLPGSFTQPGIMMAFWASAGAIPALAFTLGRRPSMKRMLTAVAILALFFAAMNWTRTSPLGRFKGAYNAIHIGMTRAEVDAVLRREFTDTLPSIRMDETGGFLGAEPIGGPNAEFIEIQMKGGRVTFKRYLPD